MASDGDPLFESWGPDPDDEDLEEVRERFAAAARPYLGSPWTWIAWALVLPAAALLTPRATALAGAPAVLGLWSVAILLGGASELFFIRRQGRGTRASTLSSWSLRTQGNLSLVALALSLGVLLHAPRLASLLPGLWLLLLGHSFYVLGGLAFAPLRRAGVLYQIGGVVALWPGIDGLLIFAATTAIGNLSIAYAIRRRPS